MRLHYGGSLWGLPLALNGEMHGRQRTHLTQAELARRVGLRKATVTEVLRGQPTSADVIHRIALALSIAEVIR